MVDYSKMSDFEINCEVAKANNWTSKSFVHGIHSGKWNPCQNADDAWHIIIDNKISLTCHQSRGEWSAVFNADKICMHVNPLRAAMIVFLMMQDAKNG